MTIQEGTIVGPYRVIRRIGSGGAGTVFVARQAQQPEEQPVAIKVLHGPSTDAAARSMAEQATAAGALRSPHVIPFSRIIDDGSRLSLVMAYAPGGSLGDKLRSPATSDDQIVLPLAPAVVVRMVSQLARALESAHAAGLVHGDIKPENIFVRTAPNGRPLAVLSDFGQSMLMTAAIQMQYRTNQIPASQQEWARQQLRFAAPEQLSGQTSPATDQYALAAVAYYLLTGRLVTDSAIPGMATAANRAASAPQLPPELDAVLRRALSAAPDQRFRSVSAFAHALEEAHLAADHGTIGVTREFARLEGNPAATGSLSSAARSKWVNGNTDARDHQRNHISRGLVIISTLAVAAGLLACVLSIRVIAAYSGLPQVVLGTAQTSNPQPGATASRTQLSSQAVAALASLRKATASTPVFTDTLQGSTHWQTTRNTIVAHADGLHLKNDSTSDVLLSPAPVSPTKVPEDMAIQVSMHLVSGHVGDFAGLVFALSSNGGQKDYYCYVISSAGQYAVWARAGGQWNFIQSGYSSALRGGTNPSNTISALAQLSRHSLHLFANGEWVADVQLPTNPALRPGGIGLIALDAGSEISFSKFSVYSAPAS